MEIKLRRGQKLCPQCKNINASRQRVCKYCRHEFISKKTISKNEITDWQNLEIGTYIKIVQGTGPYYISKQDSEEGAIGERICLGNTGVYKVIGIDDKGIHAYGATTKNGGFTYLYMGVSCKSNITGIQLEAHRIRKVRRKKTGDKNVRHNSISFNRK